MTQAKMYTAYNCSEPKFFAMMEEYETEHNTHVQVSRVSEKFNPMRVRYMTSNEAFAAFMTKTWPSA